MLNVPNLDDQRFDEILAASIEKIPYLYPEWTDYNAHDPGVTMLELFAWYKQMQQYHLNQIPERNQEAFFKLLGIRREPQRPYSLMMGLSKPLDVPLPPGTPLLSDAGVRFELTDGVQRGGSEVKAIFSRRSDGVYDVSGMFGHAQAPFHAFGSSLSGKPDELYIGIDSVEPLSLVSLWLDVADPYPVRRNPFMPDTPAPRTVAYAAVDAAGSAVPLECVLDETHALSQSGRLVLRSAAPLARGDGGLGLPRLHWIRLTLTEPGCEEMPALCRILSGYAGARQTHTLCESHEYTLAEGGDKSFSLYTHLALTGGADAYVRDRAGWYQTPCKAGVDSRGESACLRVELAVAGDIADDGAPNLRIVCYAREFRRGMHHPSTGLPAQRLSLMQENGVPLSAEASLMCLSGNSGRMRDWRYIDALHKAGAGDAVFTIDQSTGDICFGDNISGAIPPRGKDAVVITSLAYTEAAGGGITPGASLFLGEETRDAGEEPVGVAVSVLPGRGLETIGEMRARLRRLLDAPAKAVTAADCAAIALRTPGIRIAHAKAVPLMNPEGRGEMNARAHVSVVALPYNTERFPRPDQRFLDAVQAQMDRYRTVCTQMHAVGPQYIGITVWAEIIAAADEESVKAQVEQALSGYFAPDAPGARLGVSVMESELSSVVGSCPEVLGLVRLEARAAGAKCPRTSQGELMVPPYAIAYLSALELHITHV